MYYYSGCGGVSGVRMGVCITTVVVVECRVSGWVYVLLQWLWWSVGCQDGCMYYYSCCGGV